MSITELDWFNGKKDVKKDFEKRLLKILSDSVKYHGISENHGISWNIRKIVE